MNILLIVLLGFDLANAVPKNKGRYRRILFFGASVGIADLRKGEFNLANVSLNVVVKGCVVRVIVKQEKPVACLSRQTGTASGIAARDEQ